MQVIKYYNCVFIYVLKLNSSTIIFCSVFYLVTLKSRLVFISLNQNCKWLSWVYRHSPNAKTQQQWEGLSCLGFFDLRSLSVLTRGPDAAQWCWAAAELQAQLSSSKPRSHFKSPNSSRQQHYKMFLSCWAKGIMSNFCLWKFFFFFSFPCLEETLLQKHFFSIAKHLGQEEHH